MCFRWIQGSFNITCLWSLEFWTFYTSFSWSLGVHADLEKKSRLTVGNIPVVPAGTISLKCFTTSCLWEHFACLAKQRITFLILGPGSFREAWSNWRFCDNRDTICLQSLDWDKTDSRTSLGRARAFSSFPRNQTDNKEEWNVKVLCWRSISAVWSNCPFGNRK